MKHADRKISAIVACYKDGEAIPHMERRLRETFERMGCEWEIIFVNDASPDTSQSVLEELARRDDRIKVIVHSRNFGSQNAFTSGLMRATGDACVLLDGDLQDPPEVIEEFFPKWLEGYDVVYGVRTQRDMPRWLEFFYKGFYRLFKRVSYIHVPVDAGDFSLIDRSVVKALLRLPERDRFLRGLRAWVGFKQTGVPYFRPERMFGKSTNNWVGNIRWARKAIFSFSYVPLEMISLGALAVSGLALVSMFAQIIDRFLRPEIPWGISMVIDVCLFLGAVQLLSLAFIAEYIGKIFEEVKQRPVFIVERTLNLGDATAAPDRQSVPSRQPASDRQSVPDRREAV